VNSDERTVKLETMVRAGLRLRKAIEEVTPIAKMLSVPREAVEAFDETLERTKDASRA